MKVLAVLKIYMYALLYQLKRAADIKFIHSIIVT
jgi:hypothetical protein